MLNAWFYSHSIWAVAAAICFVTAAIPLIGLYFFHKWIPWNVREEDTSMVGLSYALCGGNPSVMDRSQQFFDKTDKGRAGATGNSL